MWLRVRVNVKLLGRGGRRRGGGRRLGRQSLAISWPPVQWQGRFGSSAWANLGVVMVEGWVAGVWGRLVFLRGWVDVTGIRPTRRHTIRAANDQNNKTKKKKSREHLYREELSRSFEYSPKAKRTRESNNNSKDSRDKKDLPNWSSHFPFHNRGWSRSSHFPELAAPGLTSAFSPMRHSFYNSQHILETRMFEAVFFAAWPQGCTSFKLLSGKAGTHFKAPVVWVFLSGQREGETSNRTFSSHIEKIESAWWSPCLVKAKKIRSQSPSVPWLGATWRFIV